MMLVFMRHGEAEPSSPGVKDEDRRLTERGRADVEAVASILALEIPVAYTSPLARAVETGEILCRVRGCRVEVRRELHPEDFGLEALSSLDLGEGYVLVGHNPSMRQVVESLVGGRISLKPGSAAVVEVESLRPGGGRLEALISPRMILAKRV